MRLCCTGCRKCIIRVAVKFNITTLLVSGIMKNKEIQVCVFLTVVLSELKSAFSRFDDLRNLAGQLIL